MVRCMGEVHKTGVMKEPPVQLRSAASGVVINYYNHQH
jgi:hypothetical protein